MARLCQLHCVVLGVSWPNYVIQSLYFISKVWKKVVEKVNLDLRGVGKNFGLLLVGLRTVVLLP